MVTFSAFVNKVRGERKRGVWEKLHYRISFYLERANNLWFVSRRYLSWPCTKLPSDSRGALASMGISGLSPRHTGSDAVFEGDEQEACNLRLLRQSLSDFFVIKYNRKVMITLCCRL